MVYAALFGMGKLLLGRIAPGLLLVAVGILSAARLQSGGQSHRGAIGRAPRSAFSRA